LTKIDTAVQQEPNSEVFANQEDGTAKPETLQVTEDHKLADEVVVVSPVVHSGTEEEPTQASAAPAPQFSLHVASFQSLDMANRHLSAW